MLVFLCLLSSPLTDRGYSSWWYSFYAYSPRRLLTVNLSLDATLFLFTLSLLTDSGTLHKWLFAYPWCYSFSAYSLLRLLTMVSSLVAILSLLTLLTAYWPLIHLLILTLALLTFLAAYLPWILLLMLLFFCLLSSPLTDRGSFSWCYTFSAYSPIRLLTVDPYTKIFLPSFDATLSLFTLLATYWPWIILLMLLFLCLLASPLTDLGPLHKSLFAFFWCYSFSVYSARRLLTVDPYTKVFLPSFDATLSLFTLLAPYWPWIILLMQLFHCLFSSPLTDSGPLHKSLFAFSWCYFFSAYSLRRLLTVDPSPDATLPLFTILAAYWPWILLLMLLFLCLLSSPLTDRVLLHKSLFAFSWCYSFSAYSPRRLLIVDPSLDATLSLVPLLAAYWPWILLLTLFFLCLLSSPLIDRGFFSWCLLLLCLLCSLLTDCGSFSWCYSFSAYSPRRLLPVYSSLDATLSLFTLLAAYWPWTLTQRSFCLLLMLLFLCLLSSPLTDHGFFSSCYSFYAYTPRRLLTVDPPLDATLFLLTLLVAYWPWMLLLMLLFLCLLSSSLPGHGSFSWCYSFSAYSPQRLLTVNPSLDATLSLFTLLAAYWPWILFLMLLLFCLLYSSLTDRGSFSWCYSSSVYYPRCLLTVDPSLDATLSLFTLLAAYWPWTLIQKSFCLLLMLLFHCLISSPLTDRGSFSWWYSFPAYSSRRLQTVDYSLDATLSLFTRLATYWPWSLTQKSFCLS